MIRHETGPIEFWLNSCPHATNVALQQTGAKFVVTRPQGFQRHARAGLNDLEVDSTGEIFVEQTTCRKCP